MYYPAPITAMGLSPTNSHLIVGMSDSMLSIKYGKFDKRSGTRKFILLLLLLFMNSLADSIVSNSAVGTLKKKADAQSGSGKKRMLISFTCTSFTHEQIQFIQIHLLTFNMEKHSISQLQIMYVLTNTHHLHSYI
jgi:hypothetical protein